MFAANKIGLGGSCHWCTEAIFQSLKGVPNVSQGWIEPDNDSAGFSEAVIVEFDPEMISLQDLIEIHLHSNFWISRIYFYSLHGDCNIQSQKFFLSKLGII
jgi:peptide-methionine (S)-S-oxide reductase